MRIVAAKRTKVVPKSEFAVIVGDKAFVGILGGVPYFSEDWSKAKTFDDERKFIFFQKHFKNPIRLEV